MKKLFFILILIVFGVLGYKGYEYYYSNNIDVTEEKTTEQRVVNIDSPPEVEWLTYTNEDSSVTLMYPPYLKEMMSNVTVSTQQKQEIIDGFMQYKEEGCPSTCGVFVDDPDKLDRQFTILEEVSNTCEITPELKDEISTDFILLTGGSGKKYEIDVVKSKEGSCGIKLIEMDGFDVSLSNYYYKVGFIKDDVVYSMRLKLFPFNSFESVNTIWDSFGYTQESCDADCFDKMVGYQQDLDVLTNEVVKEVVSIYDEVVGTLILTK